MEQKMNPSFNPSQKKKYALVGPPHLWKMKRDFQITFLKNQGLKKTNKLLDIGCGVLRGGIPIIEYLDKGNYYGTEVREEVLAEGKKELKAHHLEHKTPTLISGAGFNDFNLNSTFDIIFAFSVLIHLEDEIAKSCFDFVRKQLSENGVFFANVNIMPHQDGNWLEFPVVFRPLEFYEDLATQNGLMLKVLGRLDDLGHVSGMKLADTQVMLEFKKA